MKAQFVNETSFLDIGDDSNEDSFLAALDGSTSPQPVRRVVTATDLRLINKKIPVRYCEYKITNQVNKMLQTDTVSVSAHGLMIHSPVLFSVGTLLRVLMDLPDYWARKSRHVKYCHTSAPMNFQILARVVSCEDISKRTAKFQMMCENVNIDSVDEIVLSEYLGVESSRRVG